MKNKKHNKTYKGKLTSRRKQKRLILLASLVATAGIITIANLSIIGINKVVEFVKDPVPQFEIAAVGVPEAKAKEPTMKEWILNQVALAGLNVDIADKIIECESNWKPDAHAVNWNNKKGVDRGLWQISSLFHKEVSNKCAYDYKCATKEAIRIYKGRGNWSAWSCNRIIK